MTCSTVTTSAPAPVSVCVLPDGSGTPLTAAYASSAVGQASRVDATVTVIVRVCLPPEPPQPIFRYPAEDLWLASSRNGLRICPGGTIADAETDAEGRTTFTMALRAGGHTDPVAGEHAVVYISGEDLELQPLDIQFNSPDIDGNGLVDLTDTVLYSGDAVSGAYAYRSDFYYDQRLNLSDTVVFALGVGAICP